MSKLLIRKPRKYHSASYRCYGLSVIEVLEINAFVEILTTMLQLILIRTTFLDLPITHEELSVIIKLIDLMRSIQTIEIPNTVRRITGSIKIENFSEAFCKEKFCFLKSDLPKVLKVFKLDEKVFKLKNKSKATGEELLLISLARFRTKCKYSELETVFGRDRSILSHMFIIFIDYILTNFKSMLSDALTYWMPSFPQFAESIRAKIAEYGVKFDCGSYFVFGFYDDTVLECRRPGTGPLYNSQNRHSNRIQESFYNGWKKHHGFKYQTLELPNGMAADLFGPRSFRRNDLQLLDESQLNSRLKDLQTNQVIQYKAYGDGIFPIQSHLIGKHSIVEGNPLNETFRKENEVMTKIRISNEWSYGSTGNLFPLVKDKFFHKIRLSPNCAYWYFVATLLRNAYVCLYGNISTKYFNTSPPDLEEYFLSFAQ